jgi:hypothetical protein
MSSQTQSQSGSLASLALTAAKVALVVGLTLTAVVTLTLVPVVPWLKEALASFGAKTAWYLSRSMGIIAYLLMSASVMWGCCTPFFCCSTPTTPTRFSTC